VRAGRPRMFCVPDDAGLLSEKMALGNTILASTVLTAAGAYQWTPLNNMPFALSLAHRVHDLSLGSTLLRRGADWAWKQAFFSAPAGC